MTKLISSTGLSARIHHLPGREPFMLAADLAEAYQTRTDAISQAVRRNPKRFPAHFAFRLSEAEMDALKTQNVLSNRSNRDLPLAFNRAGAFALSAVLKTDVAAEVSVIVFETFAALEARAFAEMRFRMQKLQIDVLLKKPIYGRIVEAVRKGWCFDAMWRGTSYPRHKLDLAARELLDMGLIDALPEGMQPDLFGGR